MYLSEHTLPPSHKIIVILVIFMFRMKHNRTILSLLFFSWLAMAQAEHLQDGHIVPYTLFKTSQDTISITEASTLSFQDKSLVTKTHPNDIYWAKLDFSQYDSLFSNENWILQTGYLNKAEIFYQETNGNIASKIMGAFQLNKDFTGEFAFDKENLIDGRFLYLKFSIVSKRVSLAYKNIFFYKEELQDYLRDKFLYTQKSTATKISQLFLGSAYLVIIMTFIFYRTHQRREYLYYALYVFFLILYLCRISSDLYEEHIGIFSLLNYTLNTVLEMVASIFYLLFTRYFLSTKVTYPIIDKIITVFITLLLFLIVFDSSILLLEHYQLHLILLDFRMIALSLMEIFGVTYLIINIKNKLTWFIIIGSLFFSVGSLMSFLLSNFNYLRIASLAEISVFLLGLGYKIRTEHEEKSRIQEVSIQNYHKLLRAQINPHFIFNSLNSIQNLVTTNNKVSAIKYLSKFSKLLRQTLESSMENHILLSEEIQFINRYLELESLRFEDSFQYNISVDEDLSYQDIEIPQLMIQPFVENAILHGLLNKKEGEKILNISFAKNNGFLECTIDDNGIGRKASKQFKKNKPSHGMEVTQKRINTLFAETIEQKLLTITDKIDSQGNPKGTTVTIKVPINS